MNVYVLTFQNDEGYSSVVSCYSSEELAWKESERLASEEPLIWTSNYGFDVFECTLDEEIEA